MISIGSLSERITFQSETRTADSEGGASVSWSTLATTWAQVTPLSAREKWDNGQNIGQSSYRFTIRTRSDISVATRLQWEGVNYNIRAILPRPGFIYTDILATEGGAV
ncbi:MAG: phage head closure protein [Bdellovibrionales bacterium]